MNMRKIPFENSGHLSNSREKRKRKVKAVKFTFYLTPCERGLLSLKQRRCSATVFTIFINKAAVISLKQGKLL